MYSFIIVDEFIKDDGDKFNSVISRYRKDNIISYSTRISSTAYSSKWPFLEINIYFTLSNGNEINVNSILSKQCYDDCIKRYDVTQFNKVLNEYIRSNIDSDGDCELFNRKTFHEFLCEFENEKVEK